jgi:hypothetical protein
MLHTVPELLYIQELVGWLVGWLVFGSTVVQLD